MSPIIYPFALECKTKPNSVLSCMYDNKVNIQNENIFLKVMNYDISEWSNNIDESDANISLCSMSEANIDESDDDVSLCSISDGIFSDDDSDISLSSVSSEDFFSDDDSDLSLCSVSKDFFSDEVENRNDDIMQGLITPEPETLFPLSTSQIIDTELPSSKSSFVLNKRIVIPELGPIFPLSKSQKIDIEFPSCKPRFMLNEGFVTPNSENVSLLLKSQKIGIELPSCKYNFSDLITNLEISMRRTEMTRSAVLSNQINSCYVKSTQYSTKYCATFPYNSKPILADDSTKIQVV